MAKILKKTHKTNKRLPTRTIFFEYNLAPIIKPIIAPIK